MQRMEQRSMLSPALCPMKGIVHGCMDKVTEGPLGDQSEGRQEEHFDRQGTQRTAQ